MFTVMYQTKSPRMEKKQGCLVCQQHTLTGPGSHLHLYTKFNEISKIHWEFDVLPTSPLQVSATKMWVLQALAIMLSIQAGTLDLVETPPVVGNLPVAMPVPLNLPVGGLSPPVLKGPVNHQMLPPKRPVPPPKGGKCAPAARYFLSSDKLHDCK